MYQGSDFSTYLPTCNFSFFQKNNITILVDVKWYRTVVWICISLMANDGEGDGTPLQYSCLENLMDRGAW